VSVPFVPTPKKVLHRMLSLLELKEDDVLVDPGAGDCRIVIEASRHYGCVSIGIEKLYHLVKMCIERVRRENLQHKVIVAWGDLFKFEYSIATAITLYLGPELNEKLRPKLERELRPGTRVVSHDFEVPGWKPIAVETVDGPDRPRKLYLYKAGVSF